MSNLESTLEQMRAANGRKAPMPAARVETLQPDAWLDDCDGKPVTGVVFGLRTPNDKDYQVALNKTSDEDAMLYLVSRGICDHRDCRMAHPVFPMPDDQLGRQLKPATIRFLFDRIEQLHIETSPSVPLADDEELLLLGLSLQSGDQLADLPEARQARVRRIATYLIEALGSDE